VGGEAWEIHGGGFYRVEKFRLAPAALPGALQWFKWEAYVTWLSGFALLVLLYYVDPRQYLMDPSDGRFAGWELVLASLAILAHHSIPPTDMHGMSSAMETCVAVAGHATQSVAVPAALIAALLGAIVLMRFVPFRVSARPRVTRARAGPSELRISLRC